MGNGKFQLLSRLGGFSGRVKNPTYRTERFGRREIETHIRNRTGRGLEQKEYQILVEHFVGSDYDCH